MNSAHALIEKLVDKNLTIGAVESFTGGLFGKTLTDVPGSSKAFKGSLVTYSDESKVNILGIPEEFIKENGVVSYETCQQMAIKGQIACQAAGSVQDPLDAYDIVMTLY